MKQLSPRQQTILRFIQTHGPLSNAQIKGEIALLYGTLSRITIVRDLDSLLAMGLIKKSGEGRSTRYSHFFQNPLLHYIDPVSYFQKGSDERTISNRFNFDIFQSFTSIFSEYELEKLQALTQKYQKNRQAMSHAQVHKEMERLTIELSWKSSQIEGNTYSLLDTEVLIKEQKEARGHSREEALMILNHKKALDYVFSYPEDFQTFKSFHLESIHTLLVDQLDIDRGLRKKLVRIIGTRFEPLDNTMQIREAIDSTCKLINQYKDPFHKALAAVLLISYIQPFMDGNKRTARIVGNALLCAYGACPLSYRSVDSVEYKKAILLFYEQNSLSYFKDLFFTQYLFSVENYF